MKNLVVALLIISTVFACNQKPEGFVISGTIAGELENGTKVYLKKQDDNNQLVDIDTAAVENGKFTFEGIAGIPEAHYILIDELKGYTAIILENGEIELNAQKDSLGFAKIEGTPQNDMLSAFMKKNLAMSLKGMAIQEDMEAANSSNDEVAMSSLKEEMNDFQLEYKSFETDFIKANPSALVSVMLLDKAIARRTMDASKIQGIFDS